MASLPPATRLGPYEILSRLGAGGMGEVYHARDTRLGREVALKILPADVAGDLGRRARFEQEARAAAALNHPNILGLYDIGTEGEVWYLVTEYVSGETLERLLEQGPVPTRKLLDIAVQLADGMAAAHAARITHRDLKPANVMITGAASGSPGRVKILDFGLAKQASAPSVSPDDTVTVAHTQPGMILGTVSYMSPEQARGKPADYRSDQFSFGLILYEMICGRRAFERPESVQTMSAIISEDPPPIERDIPGPLRWAVERCLAKDPQDRYESSRDLSHELRNVRDHLSDTSGSMAPKPRPARTFRWKRWAVPAAFLAGLLAAFAAMGLRGGPEMPDQSAYRFTPFSFEPGGQYGAMWSPDGKAVAYAARPSSDPDQVFIRYLDSPTPLQLTHVEGGASPLAWSPDGKRLLLDLDQKPGIWSVATVGGDPVVFVPKMPPSRVTAISPDNKAIANFYPGDDGRYGVWINSPPGSEAKRYVPDPFATKDLYNSPKLRFSPDGGHLLLLMNGGRKGEEAWLLPYPPDPSHPPRRVFPDLKSYNGTPIFCWMPDSRHVVMAISPSSEAASQLWLGDTVTGERHALTSGTAARYPSAVSPDGSRIIFGEGTGNFDIVSVDLADAAVHLMMATDRDEYMPSWAVKRPLLAYVTDRNGPPEIWLHTPGSPDRPLVTARDFTQEPLQWLMGPALSPEGDRVVYTEISEGGASRLWISAASGGAPVLLTSGGSAGEFPGSWSPDGSWFAYVGIADGKANLLKVSTSGEAAPTVLKADVSYDNSAVPVWSPDGKSIALGETLYSADGQTVHSLGEHRSDAYVFAPDGKRVYGMRLEGLREVLFSVDVESGAEKVIGGMDGDYRPQNSLNPSVRLSLSPDGKSISYSFIKRKTNLWMLEGFARKKGLWARLGL